MWWGFDLGVVGGQAFVHWRAFYLSLPARLPRIGIKVNPQDKPQIRKVGAMIDKTSNWTASGLWGLYDMRVWLEPNGKRFQIEQICRLESLLESLGHIFLNIIHLHRPFAPAISFIGRTCPLSLQEWFFFWCMLVLYFLSSRGVQGHIRQRPDEFHFPFQACRTAGQVFAGQSEDHFMDRFLAPILDLQARTDQSPD